MSKAETKGNCSNQSFVVEIKGRENHTWQGTITWVEAMKKENFRSALEMMRLMDSAIGDDNNQKE